MHPNFDPSLVIERVLNRRGKAHVFDDLNPVKTALLVVDMQNAFLMPGVAHSLVETAPDIVPNINRLAHAVRSSQGLVVWIRTTFTEASLSSWSVFYEMGNQQRTAKRREALTKGNIGHALWGELDCHAGDLHVEKTNYSAFTLGSSTLAEILQSRGVDTVLITGTLTNVCCDSTARDAMMLNFRSVMVADANAAVTDYDHNAALAQFYLTFGDVMDTDIVIDCLDQAAPRLARAEGAPG